MSETLKEIKRREREKKLQEARKRQRKKLLIFLAGFLATALLLAFFLSSDYFKIKEVRMAKTEHVKEEIKRKTESLLLGKNIFRAPISRAKEVMLSDPWVREVRIKRDFPDRIEVEIVERKPVAQISKDSFYYLISDDGMVLEKSLEQKELIEIADLPLKTVKTGSRLNSREFLEAMKVYRSLDRDIKKQVLVISAPSADRLIFYIGGIEVVYGQATYLPEKNLILKEILKREGKKAISIDLRVPDNPVVKTEP